MLDFSISHLAIPEIRKSLGNGKSIDAIAIEAINDGSIIGDLVFTFKSWLEDENMFVIGSTIYTQERGFAKRIITYGIENISKFASENCVNIHHCTEFLSDDSWKKLAPIYAGLGYTLIKDDIKGNLERIYRNYRSQ